ncbi:MAG TPA: SPOR domain-containing protein [Ignavibacteriaceae bacterium]|nr:SPOR domain-containing protein [Ignavibacteriaceae bacterium]
MDTADVIRKISKKAGIPDTETKKFFEIFLKQISNILKPGESVKIPGVGLFQLRVGQIENPMEKDLQQFIYTNLIIFIGENDQISGGEQVIFNVPMEFEEKYQTIDSFFSLSIGKPIIPLKGVKASEFFIPPSGPELRGLIESKVIRLLEEAEKTEGGKETEIILFKSKQNAVDIEQVEEDVPVQSDFLKTREFENLSWDFGENLSQEIEQETNLQEENFLKVKVDEISDENKSFPVEDNEDVPHFEEEETVQQHQDEEIFEDVVDEEAEWMETEEDSEVELKDSDFEDMIVEETEDIKPTEMNAEKKEIGEIKLEKSDKDDLSLKNFQRVSSLTKEFNTKVDEEKDEDTDSEKSHPKITEVRGGFQKVRRTTAEFNFDFSGMKGLDDEPVSDKTEKGAYSYKGYRKQSKIPSIIITAVVIIALAGIIFLYLKLKSENNLSRTNNTETGKPQTKVIERNYDVPVTYPYDSVKETKKTGVPGNVSDQNVTSEKKIDTSGRELNSNQPEIRESVNAERIENYIYQYPEGIVVQVSSWKSKSIALSEVKKYRNAGYTAFAEMSTVPGMGLYYRVKVGYFNSLNEAKEFANGNQ